MLPVIRDELTIHHRIARHAAAAPQTPAFHLLDGRSETTLDRGSLLAESSAWGRRYLEAGLRPGDIVMVIAEFSPAMLTSYLGAMLVGCIPSYMPYSAEKLDPEAYAVSHAKLFRRIGARGLVTNARWLDRFGDLVDATGIRIFLAEESARGAAFVSAPAADISGETVALLQHSSGTTGLKKGVALSHRAVLAQANAYGEAIGLRDDDVIVSWLPLYHDMGLMACFVLPLINGAPVAMIDPFIWVREPWLLFDAIRKFGGTLAWLPNFAFHHLVRTCAGRQDLDLSSMRAFVNCSEPCKAETFRRFAAEFSLTGIKPTALQSCYAMAETTFAVTQSPMSQPPSTLTVDAEAFRSEGVVRKSDTGLEFLSVGTPISGTAVAIATEAGIVGAEGIVGEIAVCSDSMFSGYFRLERETADSFRDGWYLTGDIGFLCDGELFVSGRKKEIIIVRGRNFSASDIEFAVCEVPGVRPGRAVALGVFNEKLGTEEVVIIAETSADPPADLAARIKINVDNSLGLQVKSVVAVETGWLTKTTSGKISRAENLRKYLSLDSRGP